MSAEEAPRKFPRLVLEMVVVMALLGLGGYGLSTAQQQRPYLGDPLPRGAEALVPYRVLATPNLPALGLFLGSVFMIVTALPG